MRDYINAWSIEPVSDFSGDQVDLHGADSAPMYTGSLGIDCARPDERVCHS